MARQTITRSEILTFFDYHKIDGCLIWRSHWNKSAASKYVGRVAGTVNSEGYVTVSLGLKLFKVHQAVWCIEKGNWPDYEVDHINGNRSDNRIENLRLVSRRENRINTRLHREGHLPGVTFNKNTSDGTLRFESVVSVNISEILNRQLKHIKRT